MAKRIIVFLDIDGVLNGHQFNKASGCYTINRACVNAFNKIFELGLQLDFVISSAWRYMILGKAMTYEGFSYMMFTHGVDRRFRLMSITDSDEETIKNHNLDPSQLYERTTVRDLQVADSVSMFDGILDGEKLFLVIDDLNLNVPKGCGFIRTDGNVGFTRDNFTSFVKLIEENGGFER